MARRVAELQIHGLLTAGTGDSVRLDEKPPAEFLDEITGLGIEPPEVTLAPGVRTTASFTPHGWNTKAEALNRRYDQPAIHPPLDVVRRVNGRAFGARLEAEIEGREVAFGVCTSRVELDELLVSSPPPGGGWVLKAEHGNSALGNRRLRGLPLDENDRRFIDNLLREEDRVVVEPWHRRLRDLSAIFDVSVEGDIGDLAIHEVVNTSDGAFIGAIFEDRPAWQERWVPVLHTVCDRVATALAEAGYFGPVCLDAYEYRAASGATKLRVLADLNARRHASAPARRLWPLLALGRVFYWRFFTTTRLRLPTTGRRWREALGERIFDRSTARGALRLSPLWLGSCSSRRRPHKLVVAFVGNTRDDVLAQETLFREVLER